MHKNVREHVEEWYQSNRHSIDTSKIADVGAFNINGSIKDIIPHTIGFDIYDGNGVDVVIEPGVVPEEHVGKYKFVTSISSFQFCPDPDLYKKQITDLLCDGGFLFLSMCSNKCEKGHSSSPNKYSYGDEVRMSLTEIQNFFETDFTITELKYTLVDNHTDVIIKAIKNEKNRHNKSLNQEEQL
jgi:hypothetical protein